MIRKTYHILPADKSMQQEIQKKIDTKTKPPGSLGKLEDLGMQLCLIQQTLHPRILHATIVVFAGDHGIAATGMVNNFPQEVTAQMVNNFVNQGAAINIFCRENNIALQVVDAGVNVDFDPALPIVHKKIGKGTRNYQVEPAMTLAECQQAMSGGDDIVDEIFADGCNCIGFGEMGIGNTSSASLLMSAFTGMAVANCVGKGTGLNEEQLMIKCRVLEKVWDTFKDDLSHPLEVLRHFGGFEIAMMAGAYLRAAELKMTIVVDGFIATAAFLVAYALHPALMDYCVFAHCSEEQGHVKMLNYLKVQPLLHLTLRLGEGTGAALAMPMLRCSAAFVSGMASFEKAGVSKEK